MFALFPKFGARTRTQDLWPFLISETGLKFLIWTQGKIHPGNRASPVNWVHMKAQQLHISHHQTWLTRSRYQGKFLFRGKWLLRCDPNGLKAPKLFQQIVQISSTTLWLQYVIGVQVTSVNCPKALRRTNGSNCCPPQWTQSDPRFMSPPWTSFIAHRRLL